MFNLQHTIAAVQANCDIADARHAREMSMCNYLLGMRELYRWERGLPFAQPLAKGEIGAWLSQREDRWSALEQNDYCAVPVGGCELDPFDTPAINRALLPHGLVYGGGYGRWGNPNFFLAQLLRREDRAGLDVLVSGLEYARDMAAPPAALNRGTVFLRMDAMQRWLWEKVEIWGVHKPDGALKAALDCHDAADGSAAKLERMAEHESETLILHELGEALAGPLLGDEWHDMMSSFTSRRSELFARALRDNLADCLSTLPELIARGKACSLHFYFASFEGLRLSLFPGLTQAYARWRESGNSDELIAAADAGRMHWQNVAQRLLATWRNDPDHVESMIENWLENPGDLAL